MPQVYNPCLDTAQDDSPMGRGSRYMQALTCTINQRKRVQTVLALERKRYNQHLAQVTDQELRAVRRYEALQLRLQERLKVSQAEKVAAGSMTLTRPANYQYALQEKTITRTREFQKQVARTLQEMDPVYRREVEAKGLLSQARNDVRQSLAKNVGIIKTICAWRPLKPGTINVVPRDRHPAADKFGFQETGFPSKLGKSSMTVLPAITKRLTMDVMNTVEEHNKTPSETPLGPAPSTQPGNSEPVTAKPLVPPGPSVPATGDGEPPAPMVTPKPTHAKAIRGLIAKPHVVTREHSNTKAPDSQTPE